MKKEWMLLVFSVIITVLLSISLIQWLAPSLLGIQKDLQLVQVDEKIPPFYENIFRQNRLASEEFIIKDPRTRVRARPFFPEMGGIGPNDAFGFRNREIPAIADVVTIGDSQTYGNNAPLEQNWPSHMRRALKRENATLYNMSTGGWGAVQYLDMFGYVNSFKPHVVVVAFYSGNDALESFIMAYGSDLWTDMIPDSSLSKSDTPSITFPTPKEEWWEVEFPDGVKTIFTPALRLGSNQDHPAVLAGYKILGKTAVRISEIAKKNSIKVVFTIIPTKELVYAKKVDTSSLEPPEKYKQLILKESSNIQKLAKSIQRIKSTEYIDVVEPLQNAALEAVTLYPQDINGHPVGKGYEIIGKTIAEKINRLFPAPKKGLVAVMESSNTYSIYLMKTEGVWSFSSQDMIEANGWKPGNVPTVTRRELNALPYLGVINKIDRSRFGPGTDDPH